MSKRLVYTSVCIDKNYIHVMELLFESYKLAGEPVNTDLLVICTPGLEDQIIDALSRFKLKANIWCMHDVKDGFDASSARYQIFNYEHVDQYDTLLYLDADVLVIQNLESTLSIDTKGKLLATAESNIKSESHGGTLFPPDVRNRPAFNGGVLLFNNISVIKQLFNQILEHVDKHKASGVELPSHHEQPFAVYNTINSGLDDIDTIDTVYNPTTWPILPIPHFAHFWGAGFDRMRNSRKLLRMQNFMAALKEHHKNTV